MADLERQAHRSEGRVDPAFWRGRRVVVTGHSGFKGSWLALWLHHLEAEVVGLSLAPPTAPSLHDAIGLHTIVDGRTLDVRDYDSLSRALLAFKPEIIFHLAAQSLVGPSYQDPLTTFATNVMGTAHVLQAARYLPSLKCFVNVTSDKCYSNRADGRFFVEDDALGGSDPYSASKACAEIVTSAFRRSFFEGPAAASLSTARAGNVYGGGDWSEGRLIPDAIRALSSATAARSLSLRSPDAVRPWQHVLDPLRGYLLLAQTTFEQPGGESWNFGPEAKDCVSVASIADRFVGAWGGDRSLIQRASGQSFAEAKLLHLDSTKAKTRLAWQTRISLDAGLAATAEWYKAYYAGSTPEQLRALCVVQIARFC